MLFSICFRKWEIDAFSFVDACIKFSIDELSVSLWPILLLNRISTSFLISQDDKDQKLHSVCMIIEYNFDNTEFKTPHCIETIRDACLICTSIHSRHYYSKGVHTSVNTHIKKMKIYAFISPSWNKCQFSVSGGERLLFI